MDLCPQDRKRFAGTRNESSTTRAMSLMAVRQAGRPSILRRPRRQKAIPTRSKPASDPEPIISGQSPVDETSHGLAAHGRDGAQAWSGRRRLDPARGAAARRWRGG